MKGVSNSNTYIKPKDIYMLTLKKEKIDYPIDLYWHKHRKKRYFGLEMKTIGNSTIL